MLKPDADVITRLMARYQAQGHLLRLDPHDAMVRSRFGGTAYTLCALMGERTGREAIRATERYVGCARSAPRRIEGQSISGWP
ncbi:DUF5133 domain-containing protein [Streptomyces gobiensis]|uniref:DUF5133 domain-containing protein n=1 Tax=Streptomyces gobiensis TaxID=2875706 RepID=UPI001E4BDF41|nr:DUF5133 domain-containing protein [Streptomyces gobiensis]UGY91953.1 DUF5133 domain-containing protein [Streptomyces gobiensis]